MEGTPKISVVMPVYNSGIYLSETIQSLQNQTFEDFEVIFIEDASADNSADLLMEFCVSDSRFHLIKNEVRLGAANSRNKGLLKARGDYLIFLDSDDVFFRDMLSEAYTECISEEADMVIFGYNTEKFTSQDPTEKHTLMTTAFRREVLPYDEVKNYIYMINPVPWNKLVRREFIMNNGIVFQDIPNNNDVFYSFAAMFCANRLVISDKVLLTHKRNRAGSLTSGRMQKENHMLKAYQEVYRFIQDRRLGQATMQKFIAYVIEQSVSLVLNPEYSMEVRGQLLKQMKEKYQSEMDITLLEHEELSLRGIYFVQYMNNNAVEPNISDFDRLGPRLVKGRIEECHLQGEKIALWGCGELGKRLLLDLEPYQVFFDYVIDNNPTLQGSTYNGYLIHSYESIRDKIDIILLTNRRLLREIQELTGKEKRIIWL